MRADESATCPSPIVVGPGPEPAALLSPLLYRGRCSSVAVAEFAHAPSGTTTRYVAIHLQRREAPARRCFRSGVGAPPSPLLGPLPVPREELSSPLAAPQVVRTLSCLPFCRWSWTQGTCSGSTGGRPRSSGLPAVPRPLQALRLPAHGGLGSTPSWREGHSSSRPVSLPTRPRHRSSWTCP
jgi:hypothetical protein